MHGENAETRVCRINGKRISAKNIKRCLSAAAPSSEITENGAFVFKVRFAEGRRHVLLFLKDLKMQHDNGKQGEKARQRIAVHEQHAEIHKIESEKGGVSAEGIDPVCDEFGFVAFGNARAPTVLHEKHCRKENSVAQKREKKAGEPCAVGKAAQTEQNGGKLRGNDAVGCNGHQNLNRVQRFFFTSPNLARLYAVPFLNEGFGEINSVKKRERRKRKPRKGKVVFKSGFYHAWTP